MKGKTMVNLRTGKPLTTFQCADALSCNVTSVKNWIKEGHLEAHRTPGGHWRITSNALIEFCDRTGRSNPLSSPVGEISLTITLTPTDEGGWTCNVEMNQ